MPPKYLESEPEVIGVPATATAKRPTVDDDPGVFAIDRAPMHRHAFKTPTLRNIALTSPYMHDGSSATLEEVIELYDRGGGDAPNKSKLIYKLNLTAQDKADLVAFMKSLNGTLPQMKAPAMYPEADVHSKGEPGRQ